MKKVIDFIIKQELETIDEFPNLIKPLNENFDIQTRDGKYRGEDAVEILINCVINWETHPEISDSLEKILNEKFCLI